jgi:hypothetical protein
VVVGYDEVEVRRRDAGLAIDALVEGGRLILDVARGTFARLAVVGRGAPPGRATWLPPRTPLPRAEPPQPAPLPWMAGYTEPPEPPGGATYAGEGGNASSHQDTPTPAPSPAPTPQRMPTLPPPGYPPPGWHPDPSGRHWWRWWDGLGWTDHVADGGAPFVDPLPPRD